MPPLTTVVGVAVQDEDKAEALDATALENQFRPYAPAAVSIAQAIESDARAYLSVTPTEELTLTNLDELNEAIKELNCGNQTKYSKYCRRTCFFCWCGSSMFALK